MASELALLGGPVEYADAFNKVAEHHADLLPGDTGDPPELGGWGWRAVRRADLDMLV